MRKLKSEMGFILSIIVIILKYFLLFHKIFLTDISFFILKIFCQILIVLIIPFINHLLEDEVLFGVLQIISDYVCLQWISCNLLIPLFLFQIFKLLFVNQFLLICFFLWTLELVLILIYYLIGVFISPLFFSHLSYLLPLHHSLLSNLESQCKFLSYLLTSFPNESWIRFLCRWRNRCLVIIHPILS